MKKLMRLFSRKLKELQPINLEIINKSIEMVITIEVCKVRMSRSIKSQVLLTLQPKCLLLWKSSLSLSTDKRILIKLLLKPSISTNSQRIPSLRIRLIDSQTYNKNATNTFLEGKMSSRRPQLVAEKLWLISSLLSISILKKNQSLGDNQEQ